MLTVTGSAEFLNDGKTLVAKIAIQPHFPNEHDALERVANSFPESLREQIRMEKGNLIISEKFDVPGLPKESPASAPDSGATSASDSGTVIDNPNAVQQGIAPSANDNPEGNASSGALASAGAPASSEELLPGDFVQWVSQGVEQFAEPKPIVKISEDGKFAFFEDSATGVPVEQLHRMKHESLLHKMGHELKEVGEKVAEVGVGVVANVVLPGISQ